jgi:hypothetical protein
MAVSAPFIKLVEEPGNSLHVVLCDSNLCLPVAFGVERKAQSANGLTCKCFPEFIRHLLDVFENLAKKRVK